MIWKTRRQADRLHIKRLEAALIELHEFIEAELDPDPHPWASYYTNPMSNLIAAQLQERTHPARDQGEPSDV